MYTMSNHSTLPIIFVILFSMLSFGCASLIPTSEPINICEDPSFDAAVSISESQILLFKGAFLWVLDLVQYQVGNAYPNKAIVNACSNDSNDFLSDPYYVWTQHHEDKYFKNKICLERAGHICQLVVDVVPSLNDIFFLNSTYTGIEVVPGIFEYSQMMCQKDVNNDIIEIMISRKSFYQPNGIKQVWLRGRHFNAYVSYTPTTYDINKVIFKMELLKLYREYESEDDSKGSEIGQYSMAATRDKVIENVLTFVTLPYGEVMVFFANEFCYINYYDLKCNRRSTLSLIGCTMPNAVVSQNQLHIVRQVPDSESTSVRAPPNVFDSTNGPSQKSTNSTISEVSVTFVPISFPTASTRTGVGNGSESGGVSTLPGTEPTREAAPVTSVPLPTTTATSSLSTLFNSTSFANAATRIVTLTTQAPVSTDSNWTTLSSVVATSNGTDKTSISSSTSSSTSISTISIKSTSTNTFGDFSSSPKSYDVDFLHRKRDAFKRGIKHGAREFDFGNMEHHLHFLYIGFSTFCLLFVRAVFLFFLVIVTSHIAAIVFIVIYSCLWRKVDTKVLFLIYQSMFVRTIFLY